MPRRREDVTLRFVYPAYAVSTAFTHYVEVALYSGRGTLGSESRNLPGYVVLNAGRGTSGGTSNWGSGFLPSTHAGTLFRNQGEPVLNLNNPPGVTDALQARTIEAVRDLNGARAAAIGDPEVNSRTAAYELAFRMQAAAPELIDLSKEDKRTLDAYGASANPAT